MIAAIYARKSTDQSGVSDDQKSVTRQLDHARRYAERKGWTAVEEHVYVDDGISGAEFANRPGFLRLMNALKPRAPFQALIMSEESRLGREAIETAYALKQLITSGVRVFFYLEDRERTLDSPTDKIMLSLTTFADELEREKTRQRVTDAMLRKARAGHVCGGRTFGYDNVEITMPDGKRSHVERRINETEAAVVRRIFELSANGTGFTRIAKLLNAEGAVTPRAQQKRPNAWAPTSVKEVIDRRLYLGEVVWNKTRKRNHWGQNARSNRPESEWLRQSVPPLRIVSDDLWATAHSRLTEIRSQLGPSLGRRRRDADSPYLLAGFARCAVCGGAFCSMSRNHGKERAYFYGCSHNHKRGITVCDNHLVMRTSTLDAAVLETLGGKVLRPAVAMAIIDGVLTEMAPKAVARTLERLRQDLFAADRALSHLSKAIAAGGPLEALLTEMKARQDSRNALAMAIVRHEESKAQRFDRPGLEQTVTAHIAAWRDLLATKHVEDGRRLLREALRGPIRFTPEKRSYRFEGSVAFDRLLAGVAGFATFVASPTGSADSHWERVIAGDTRRAA